MGTGGIRNETLGPQPLNPQSLTLDGPQYEILHTEPRILNHKPPTPNFQQGSHGGSSHGGYLDLISEDGDDRENWGDENNAGW